jgi:DNA gyrase/topoisomerase IV subunit B
VCRLNRDNHALHEPALCSATAEGVEVSLALQWASDTFSDTMVGFANSIKTIDGGSHMEGLRAALTRLINSLAKKNKVRGACGYGCRPYSSTAGHPPPPLCEVYMQRYCSYII